ncbi:MAG: c-type cytochrome [Pseudomonadaceae bacterium]|nr:c-type cytochrome [Pseudomonadaceae bacterium]
MRPKAFGATITARRESGIENKGKTLRILILMSLALLIAGCGDSSSTDPASSNAALTAPPVSTAPDGEGIYNKFCFSCHAAGVAGAPKLGDVEAWAPRIAQGMDVLMKHVVEGMPPGMPAKGLCNQCSNEELAASLDYMLDSLPKASDESEG